MKKLNFIQRLLHNKLGWAYPTEKLADDAFQPVFRCVCGGDCAQDSTNAWFHLGADPIIIK